MIIVIFEIYISQGSVTTQIRCLGIFSNHFVTNLPQNVPVKKFENRSLFLANIWIKVCGYFGGHPVYRTGIYGYGYIHGYPRKICGYGYGYGWKISYPRQPCRNVSSFLRHRVGTFIHLRAYCYHNQQQHVLGYY